MTQAVLCKCSRRTWREFRPLTHFLHVCSLKSYNCIWNISEDYCCVIPSLYSEIYLFIAFYYHFAMHFTLSFVHSQWWGSIILMIAVLGWGPSLLLPLLTFSGKHFCVFFQCFLASYKFQFRGYIYLTVSKWNWKMLEHQYSGLFYVSLCLLESNLWRLISGLWWIRPENIR